MEEEDADVLQADPVMSESEDESDLVVTHNDIIMSAREARRR